MGKGIKALKLLLAEIDAMEKIEEERLNKDGCPKWSDIILTETDKELIELTRQTVQREQKEKN